MTSVVSRPLSQVLEDILNEFADEKISLQMLADQLGVRAYGALFVLLSIPNFIPGASFVSGILLLIFSIQMILGVKELWLPKVIGKLTIHKQRLAQALNTAQPFLSGVEHYIRPRMRFINSAFATRLIGLAVAIFSVVILLPIPFSNIPPSLAVLLVALGMIQKDGLTVLSSTLIGLIYCTGFIWLTSSILLKLLKLL